MWCYKPTLPLYPLLLQAKEHTKPNLDAKVTKSPAKEGRRCKKTFSPATKKGTTGTFLSNNVWVGRIYGYNVSLGNDWIKHFWMFVAIAFYSRHEFELKCCITFLHKASRETNGFERKNWWLCLIRCHPFRFRSIEMIGHCVKISDFISKIK